MSSWQIINYSWSSFIAFLCKFLFFTGVISISISGFFFHSFSSSQYNLETSLLAFRPNLYPCKAFGQFIVGRKNQKGSFSYLSCLQLLWLFATCLGSDRATHGLLSGLSSAVLWLKRCFLPFHLCTGDQRQLKRWGRCQLSLSRAEKAAVRVSLECTLSDSIAAFTKNFHFPFVVWCQIFLQRSELQA